MTVDFLSTNLTIMTPTIQKTTVIVFVSGLVLGSVTHREKVHVPDKNAQHLAFATVGSKPALNSNVSAIGLSVWKQPFDWLS